MLPHHINHTLGGGATLGNERQRRGKLERREGGGHRCHVAPVDTVSKQET